MALLPADTRQLRPNSVKYLAGGHSDVEVLRQDSTTTSGDLENGPERVKLSDLAIALCPSVRALVNLSLLTHYPLPYPAAPSHPAALAACRQVAEAWAQIPLKAPPTQARDSLGRGPLCPSPLPWDKSLWTRGSQRVGGGVGS